jgi:hypothetical protein
VRLFAFPRSRSARAFVDSIGDDAALTHVHRPEFRDDRDDLY